MKNKKWYGAVIVIMLIAVTIMGVVIYRSMPNKSEDVKIQRTSAEFIHVGDSRVEKIDINTDCKDLDNFKLLKPKDYKSTMQLDPAYWVEPAMENPQGEGYQYAGSFCIPLLQGMEYTVSTIEYEINGQRKTADIGRHKISIQKGKDLYEKSLDMEENQDVVVMLDTEGYGKLVKAEVVNKDLKTMVRIELKQGNAFVYLLSPSFQGYDEVLTNMKYTFEKDGKQTVYYGTATLSFGTDRLNYTYHHVSE